MTCSKLYSKLLAWIFPVIIPVCHIFALWKIYSNSKVPVDTVNCDCSCWDTVFKGPYEHNPNSYKEFYFNATKTTAKIWLIVVTGVIMTYESYYRMCRLIVLRRVRWSMLFLFLTSLFPNYYTWWITLNYYNDGYFIQWRHQMFFTVTELIATGITFYYSNVRKQISLHSILILLTISLNHISISAEDQFIVNVWKFKGARHQIFRDIGLMLHDIFHVLIPCALLLQKILKGGIKTTVKAFCEFMLCTMVVSYATKWVFYTNFDE